MAQSKIIITGIPPKAPQISNDGDVILLFKTTQEISIANDVQASNSYCKVTIRKNLWKPISNDINETTYYVIEGAFKASVTSKGTPFISVICSKIKVVNGLIEDENSPGSFKFPGNLPDDTNEVIPISLIKIPENLHKPKTAKDKAFAYFKKHGTFSKPIVLKKDTMTLVSGYANYLIAKELNIEIVPVSYNLITGATPKDEFKIKNIQWFLPDEVTEIHVKDIVLTEDIHLNVQNFTFKIDLMKVSKTNTISVPVAVRPIDKEKYALVTGVARYFAAKILNIEKIPAVITDMSHDEFVEDRFLQYNKTDITKGKTPKRIEGETLISLITVPQPFLRTRPNPAKIKETIEYYSKHGKFDKPVVIKGDMNLLIDGYKRYVAAKELNLTSIWTIKIK